MKPKVYIETSIISYLTARRSTDLVVLTNQLLTIEWWENHRTRFDTFVSEPVINEIEKGNAQMAKLRLDAVREIRVLVLTDEAGELAEHIISKRVLPPHASVDILHISIASVYKMDFLLSLNCRHIANAVIYKRISNICTSLGYKPPTVCTPLQMLEME